MEKIKYSGISKFIATVVVTCSFTCFILMLILSAFYAEVGGSEGMKKDVYAKVADNYMYEILEVVNAHPETCVSEINKITSTSRLEDCVVIKTDNPDLAEVSKIKKEDYLYGSPENIANGYQYSHVAHKGVMIGYDVSSLIGVLTSNHYIYTEDFDDEYDVKTYGYSDDDVAETYYIVLASCGNGEFDDLFTEADEYISEFARWGDNAVVYEFISALIMIISIAFLYSVLGRKSNDGEIQLRFVDKIPFAIYTIIIGMIEGLAIGGFVLIAEVRPNIKDAIIFGIELSLIMAFVGIAYVASIITRIRAKKFWRYTVCYYIGFPYRKLKSYANENLNVFWKTTLFLIGFFAAALITGLIFMLMSLDVHSAGPMIVWALAAMSIFSIWVYKIVFQLIPLKEGVERIAAGELEQPINTEKLVGDFKKHAENINAIGNGIDIAVQERMKSERFKTELITNVSHDIKTPLTSIINYVDLMKKENITDETLLEYMDVLDRQSARLKKLIEDLMEASKASTGNLAVNLEECDISVILGQAVGEFEEKMTAKGLIPVVTYPDEPISVSVDGRHLWRVFDNLLNNICKYAQEGTRVYINVYKKESNIDIVFKNISSTQLNISSEELMERFVRGDSSRNTEGSGLGLSIARSLTELMNGELQLDVDGDLFKVTLTFML